MNNSNSNSNCNSKSGEQNEKTHRKTVAAPPPDGGWGWMVVFGSFMIHVIADGVAYSFGLFFSQISNSAEMEASKSDASWIGSIMLGVTFGAGPIASIFVNKFGCRAVSIAGSFVAAFGFAISYWAANVHFLYGSIGLIGGLGLGLIYLPAIVCVSYYFEKKRAFATGIAVCGSGFGTFALAPVLDFMIRSMGWRASFLGVALILLGCIIFAAFFRPLPTTVIVSIDESEFQNPNYELELNYGPQYDSLQFELEETRKGNENGSISASQTQNQNQNQKEKEKERREKDPLDLDFEEIALKTDTITRRATASSVNCAGAGIGIPDLISSSGDRNPCRQTGGGGGCSRSLSDYENSVSMGNSISNYNCDDLASSYRSRRDSTSLNNFLEHDSQFSQSRTRFQENFDKENEGRCSRMSCKRKMASWMNWTKMMDMSLFTNPVFLFFAFSNFLTNVGTNVPYICYADMAKDILNTKEDDPSLGWIVSSIGIANTGSRFIMGYLSDTKYVNRLYLYSGSLMLCGIATAVSAHGESLTELVVCAFIFGASGGIYVGLTSVILVDLLGLNKLSNAFGIVLFCQGVGTLIGPPIVGLLHDKYKHYVYGFWFAGISIFVSGSMLFLIPLIQRYLDARQSPVHQNPSSPSTRRTSLFSISKD